MKKIFLSLLSVASVCTATHAASLFVKLIDEREQPVANAYFYWKHPNQEEYKRFEKQAGNGQLRNHPEGFVYNYEIAKSVRVGGDKVDIKIVADGYEVKVINEWIPDGSDPRESQILVVLDPEKRRGHAGTPINRQNNSNARYQAEPAKIDIQVKNQIDPRIDDGPPLAGVIVEVMLEATGEIYSAQTDAAGFARFNVPEAGMADIWLRKNEFRNRHWKARLEPGRTEIQQLTLSKLSPPKNK